MEEITDETRLREIITEPVRAVAEKAVDRGAKAFLRSSLWDTATWPDRRDVPSAGRIAKSQSGAKVPAGVIDAALHLEARFNRY